MSETSRKVDWSLVGIISLILVIALLNLFGATAGTPMQTKFYFQLGWIVVGWGVFAVMAKTNHFVWMRFAWWALLAINLTLLCLPLLADVVKGSERWVKLGPVRLQPSELAKFITIVAVARLVEEIQQGVLGRWHLIARILLLSSTVGLIVIQPDLGTAAMIALTVGTVGLMMLRNIRPVIALGLVSLACIPLLWKFFPETFEYQEKRIMALIAADETDTEKGWQSNQSKIAIGSGGAFGKGLGQGTQSKYGWLPEYWTDFPFSEWAEQTGMLGSIPVIFLYGFLTVWLLAMGVECKRKSDAAICFGAAAMIFWHSLVNLSMGLGVAPVVGLTLPLFSYGGSSLVTVMAVLGLVSAVRGAPKK